MPGGLIYFTLNKDGNSIPPDKVCEMSRKSRDILHAAVYTHFHTYKPAAVNAYQVELNDYGLLIDYATDASVPTLMLPDITLTLANKQYTVVFQDWIVGNTEKIE